MATERKIRGVDTHLERDPQADLRDSKSIYKKTWEYLRTREGIAITFGFFALLMVALPMFAEFLFVMAFTVGYFLRKASEKTILPLRMPVSSGMKDWSEGARGKYGKASGIAFLGNEMKTNNEIWVSSSDMRTHILIFGTTGAGKALSLKEKVLTKRGWVENQHLTLTDKVMTPSGLYSDIVGIFPQGKKSFKKIIFEDGTSSKVSEDHLWEIYINPTIIPNSFNNLIESKNVVSTKDIEKLLKDGKSVYIPQSQNITASDCPLTYSIDQIGKAFLTNDLVLANDLIINGSLRQRKTLLTVIQENVSYNNYQDGMFFFDDLKQIKLLGLLYKSLGYTHTISKNTIGGYILKAKLKALLKINAIEKSGVEEAQCIKIDDPRGLFVIENYIVTHNTEFLLSLAFNCLVQGSGFLFCDGKGDPSLFSKVFSMVRLMGRDDDLLTLNFMTGGAESFGKQKTKRSNTLNPFIFGSSSSLTEMLVGLMADGGGGDPMWKGRAMSLLSSQMKALVYLRDHKEKTLDISLIREYMTLEKIYELAEQTEYDGNGGFIKEGLQGYLLSIPGYVKEKKPSEQSSTTRDQHGYLQMQFTQLLSSLGETYGYIFKTNLGEIDFKDVVLNNRILVVPLPALEKSIDELRNLGKLVIINLKSMMTNAMGAILEGDYSDLIESRPTNSPAPFLAILDEYGYYAAPGSAVIPAQGRSLGFSVCFAGQDYAGFKKGGNQEEASSTIGNTNIKIAMKIEDPNETFDIFNKAAGQAYVEKLSGKEYKQGALFGKFRDQLTINTDKRDRITFLDLKQQQNGEAHVFFNDQMIRANLFWLNPPNPKKMRLNHFVKVKKPKREEIKLEVEKPINLLKILQDEQTIREKLDVIEATIQKQNDSISKLSDFIFDAKTAKFTNNIATQTAITYLKSKELSVTISQMSSDMGDIFDADSLDVPGESTVFAQVNGLDKVETTRAINNINEALVGNGVKTLSEEERERSYKITNDTISEMEKITKYPSAAVPPEVNGDELRRMIEKLNLSFQTHKDE